jgi:hypothetical protein
LAGRADDAALENLEASIRNTCNICALGNGKGCLAGIYHEKRKVLLEINLLFPNPFFSAEYKRFINIDDVVH